MSELERWQTRFGTSDYIFGKEPNAFLKAQAHRLPASGSALSIADGEGRNGVWLAQQGLDVLAVDFSPAALEKSRALAAERGVRLRTEVADVTTWRPHSTSSWRSSFKWFFRPSGPRFSPTSSAC
jgi:SAM-dependent methyltransferase